MPAADWSRGNRTRPSCCLRSFRFKVHASPRVFKASSATYPYSGKEKGRRDSDHRQPLPIGLDLLPGSGQSGLPYSNRQSGNPCKSRTFSKIVVRKCLMSDRNQCSEPKSTTTITPSAPPAPTGGRVGPSRSALELLQGLRARARPRGTDLGQCVQSDLTRYA